VHFASLVGVDHLCLAIDLGRPVADVELDAVFAIPVDLREHQFLGVAMGEERGEADAVVRGPRLLAERDDAKLALDIHLDQLLAEAVTDHAVADDDDRALIEKFVGHWAPASGS
jgi:hypothetical protein